MKKLILLFSLFVLFWFSSAANQPNIWEVINQQSENNFYNEDVCWDWHTFYQTKNYYVWDDFYFYDTHWWDSNGYAYIYDRATNIRVIDPYNVFDFDDSFRFKSNGKPTWVYKTKFVENDWNFLLWNLVNWNPDVNNGELVAQLVVNLHRQWYYNSNGSASYSISYWPMPNGPQSTSSFNNYYVWNYNNGWLECFNYVVHYCGDGDVDTAQSIAMLEWGNQNSIANEQCDPADPSHEWWGNQGCSDICEPINQTIDPPTCTLGYTSIGNDQFLIYWNINGTFYTPSSINIVPNTLVQSSYSVLENQGQWVGVEPTEPGTYTATMVVTNQWGSNSCQTTFTLQQQEEAVCGDGNIDSPNDDGVYEQCDDGNNTSWDGCQSDCTLTVPHCNLMVNPQTQNLWEAVLFSATKSAWADYTLFDLDDGNILNNNINFNYSYNYLSIWNYNPKLTVTNAYSPIANNITRPTYVCDTNVNIVQQNPDLDIDKILDTQWYLQLGDFVDYTIVLTNNGDWISNDTYIEDIMPKSLDLISHSIQWISNYDVNQWQDIDGIWHVKYENFDLTPGQTATMSLRWQVRQDAQMSETTNCAYTIGDYDCEIYSLNGAMPYIQKYQTNLTDSSVNQNAWIGHMAASNQWWGLQVQQYTTWLMYVQFGDRVKYKIRFGNEGAFYTNGGVRVVDHMPKCVDYITANIYGVEDANFQQSVDENGRWILEYNGFDLDAGQYGTMFVEWQIRQDGECANIDIYTNDSYIYFHDPLNVISSSTTAIRTDNTVDVYKDGDEYTKMIGEDKQFTIWVENNTWDPITNIVLEDVWPNPDCIQYVDWQGVGFVKDPLSLTWTYAWPLQAGKSTVLNLDATIANDVSCAWLYTNIVNMTYIRDGVEWEGQASYNFEVIAPSQWVQITKNADKSSVSVGDTIIYTITYKNVWGVQLDSYVVTDYWPDMIELTNVQGSPSILTTNTWSILTWTFNNPLAPGQEWTIIVEGIVQ